MAHINLLPWREEQRTQQKKQFGMAVLLSIILAGLVVLYAHLHIAAMIDSQNARNSFLDEQIKILDKRIEEIQDLESTKAKLQARINIIQELQRSRPGVVHLFDEVVRTLPDGVYVTSLVQKGNAVALEGIAQSNARVSTYMHNIDKSLWLGGPKLGVISANNAKDAARSNKFVLNASQITPKPGDADSKGVATEVTP
jgi:type IV pilus assembly protein PilN